MLDEIRFWSQVITDSRRTILCSPENESRIKGWLDAQEFGLYTVRASQVVPDDVVYVIDEQALEAETSRYLNSTRPWGSML